MAGKKHTRYRYRIRYSDEDLTSESFESVTIEAATILFRALVEREVPSKHRQGDTVVTITATDSGPSLAYQCDGRVLATGQPR